MGRRKDRPTRRRFCSRRCATQHMVGSEAPNWKDGLSTQRERARMAPDIRKWRAAVFQRDGYRCQHCGSTDVLHAHHVIEWAKDEQQRFSVDNGLTLCVACHGLVHDKDFTNRRVKHCPYCERPTAGEGIDGRCRSCATRIFHAERRGQTSLPFPPRSRPSPSYSANV